MYMFILYSKCGRVLISVVCIIMIMYLCYFCLLKYVIKYFNILRYLLRAGLLQRVVQLSKFDFIYCSLRARAG